MPEYILTGRDRRGRTVTDIVVAESADEAVRLFETDHTDITLHTDDNAALFLKPSQVRKTFTPREYLGYRTRGRVGCTLFMIRKLYAQTWWADAVVALALATGWWLGLEWGIVQYLGVGLLVFPIPMAVYAELTSKAIPYRRTLLAVLGGRWEDVARHIRKVRAPLPPFERPFREAQALAGLGRLDEALDHFRPVADDPAVPHHMYWSYRGLIYQAARERDKALECASRAAELAADNPVVLIEYALALLNVRGDTRQARDCLARARRHALSDVSTPLCEYAEGVLAVKERRPADAVPLLDGAARALGRFTGGNPGVGIVVARIRAHLALAHAANGDHEAARRAYRQAEHVLAAHDAPELARCREVLG